MGALLMNSSNFAFFFLSDVIGFPFVVIDGEQIGGLVEVAKLFLEKNLVSVKKK